MLCPGYQLDVGIEAEVLPDSQHWPENVELGTHAQVLPDGRHVCAYRLSVDPCIACAPHVHAQQAQAADCTENAVSSPACYLVFTGGLTFKKRGAWGCPFRDSICLFKQLLVLVGQGCQFM